MVLAMNEDEVMVLAPCQGPCMAEPTRNEMIPVWFKGSADCVWRKGMTEHERKWRTNQAT